MSDSSKPIKKPFLLRFILFVARPFGFTYVEQDYAQIITRFGQFHAIKGPGIIWHAPLLDSLGPLAYVGGDMVDTLFRGIMARDVIPVNIRLLCFVEYDPRASLPAKSSAPRKIPALAGVPRQVLKEIAASWFEWALRSLANRYYATELTQTEVKADLEKQIRELAEQKMQVLSLRPIGDLRLMQVELPASLTERQEMIAQRRASIEAGGEYNPEVVRSSLVAEIMEKIAKSNSEMSLLNVEQLVNAYLGMTPSAPAPVSGPPGSPPAPPSGAPSPQSPPAEVKPKSRL